MSYEKTKDPNIIKWTHTDVEEIHLDKLRKRIKLLEQRVKQDKATDKWYGNKIKSLKALLTELEGL